MPIERSSCHHSLLEFAFGRLVSGYLLLAVSRELKTNERRCLGSFMSNEQCERDALLNARSRSFIAFKIAGVNHGFILWVIVMVRIGASLSKMVFKAVVMICFSIVSIVLSKRGSEKSSSNLFSNLVYRVFWSNFESWRVFIVTVGGLGWVKNRLRVIKSWLAMNGESDWEKLWIQLRSLTINISRVRRVEM